MPTVIPTRRPLLTAERAAILVACIAVLCSLFLVAQTVRAEPASALLTAACGGRSATAASTVPANEPGLEPVRRQ
jgi:hypothetical protein